MQGVRVLIPATTTIKIPEKEREREALVVIVRNEVERRTNKGS